MLWGLFVARGCGFRGISSLLNAVVSAVTMCRANLFLSVMYVTIRIAVTVLLCLQSSDGVTVCVSGLCFPYAEHDHDELMLLATDAQHAKEVALGELEKVRAMARQERDQRAKQMREKQVSDYLRHLL